MCRSLFGILVWVARELLDIEMIYCPRRCMPGVFMYGVLFARLGWLVEFDFGGCVVIVGSGSCLTLAGFW